jgi:hypothetical protein
VVVIATALPILAESRAWIGMAHFGAGLFGCEHPFDASPRRHCAVAPRPWSRRSVVRYCPMRRPTSAVHSAGKAEPRMRQPKRRRQSFNDARVAIRKRPDHPNTPCFGDRATSRHFGWRRGSTPSWRRLLSRDGGWSQDSRDPTACAIAMR